jgi:hypothetical protein
MQIGFVMRTDDMKEFAEANGEKWFRISANGQDPIGWVSASGVSLWNTRLALKAIGVPGRKFVVKRTDGGPDVVLEGVPPDNYQCLAFIVEPRASVDEPFASL